MTLPRTILAAALVEALPADVRVLAYARDTDRPARDVVMLRLDTVTNAPPGRNYAFTLVLVGHRTDDRGPGDDALDALLADVLHALDTHPALANVSWTEATRGTYLDTTHPAYEVATTTRFTEET